MRMLAAGAEDLATVFATFFCCAVDFCCLLVFACRVVLALCFAVVVLLAGTHCADVADLPALLQCAAHAEALAASSPGQAQADPAMRDVVSRVQPIRRTA